MFHKFLPVLWLLFVIVMASEGVHAGQLTDLDERLSALNRFREADPDLARLDDDTLARAIFKIYGKGESFETFQRESLGIDLEREKSIQNISDSWCNGYFEGEILPEDYDKFKKIGHCSNQNIAPMVWVDSEGGDIYTAMKIGRLLRQLKATVIVSALHHTARCYSSCIFLLSGAVTRLEGNDALVGIHRPYTRDTSATQTEVNKKFAELDRLTRAYLREMNIPSSLFEEMMLIPPEQMRQLSSKELIKYGLLGYDPLYEEAEDNRLALRYKLSKEEYLRRKRRVSDECYTREMLGLIQECYEKTYQGLR